MATGYGGDIELKVDLDVSPAKKSASSLRSIIDKALGSGDTKVRSMGLQLQKASQRMETLTAKMRQMESTKIPTEQYTQLQNELKTLDGQIAKVTADMQKMQEQGTHQTYSSEYTKLLEDQKWLLEQLAPLQEKYEANKSVGFTDDQMSGMDWYKEYQALGSELRDVEGEMQALIDLGQQYSSTPEFQAKQAELEALQGSYADTEQSIQNLEAANADYITQAEADPATYNKVASDADNATTSVGILAQKINEATSNSQSLRSAWDSFKNTASSTISRVTDWLKSKFSNAVKSTSNSHNTSFKKMLTTVLKYGFGIRSIYFLFRKIRSTISTGLTEMSNQFSSVSDDVYSLKNSWSGFKSSLVSAFQPIFSYVVPALTTLINYLTSAMNALANFFAMLTGSSTYYKAVKGNESVADSVSGTGSAAAEANEELADYDDLIVIEQDSSSGGGSGGSGSSGSAWNWEETAVEATSLSDKLSNVWDVFKSAWESKGKAVIESAKYALNSLKSLISTIANTIYEVFVDGYGQSWLESVLSVTKQILLTIADIATAWEKAWTKDNNGYNMVASFFEMLTSINTMIATIMQSWRNAWNDGSGVAIIEDILQSITNIQTTVKNLADNFTEAWNKAGVGDSIMNTILDIVEDITDFINQITAATAEWSASLDFYPLLSGIDGVLKSIENVVNSIKTIALSIYNNFILPLSKKIIESYLPTLLEDAETALSSISGLLDSLPWDTITTSLEKIAELVIEIGLAHIADNLKSTSSAMDSLGKIIESTTTIWSTFKEVIEEVFGIEFNSEGFDAFKTFISTISAQSNPASLALKLMKAGLEAVATVLEEVSTTIENNKDTLINIGSDIWEGIKEGFQDAIDWAASVKEVFDNFVSKVKEFFGINSPAENVKYLGGYILDGIIEGFKDKFTSIKNSVSELYSTFKAKLTEKFQNFKITDLFSNVGNMAVTLTTTLAGTLTSLVDFETVSTFFSNVKEKWNDLKSTIKTTLSGAVTKVSGATGNTLENLSSTWKKLKENWTNKEATLTGTLSGIFGTAATGIDDVRTKFENLKTTWTDDEATLKAKVGGQINSIGEMIGNSDSWASKFTNFVQNIWQDDTATMKANAKVAGSDDNTLSNMKSGGGWYNTFTNFVKNVWTDDDATMTAKAKVAGSDDNSLSGLSTWASKLKTFKTNDWTDSTAKFDTDFEDFHGSKVNSAKSNLSELYNYWYGRTADFELSFSGTSNTSGIRSAFKTVISEINNALKSAGISGVHISSDVVDKYLAQGGIIRRRLIMGEDGQEAIIPLERNLGWMDKMATAISGKIMDMHIPGIATGQVLPANSDFYKSSTDSNNKVVELLEDMIRTFSSNNVENKEPIVIQVDGRQMAQIVWDETDKRYKQLGRAY